MELGGIIKKIWDDPNYKKEFLSDPKKKLQEEGLKVPGNVKVIVHENTPDEIHVVIPSEPTGELTEEQLASLSGGFVGLVLAGWGAAALGHVAGGLVSGGKMPRI